MKLALDTSAYSAFMRGHRQVVPLVRRADAILLPAIVLGELHAGFRSGSKCEENLAHLDEFLASPLVEPLAVTADTADRFGRIVAALRRAGRPIPTNDVWIAAQAMEAGADLLSSDRHFDAVDGLGWVPFSAVDQDGVRERVRAFHAR